MWVLILEIFIVLAMAVFIVWWTMSSRRRDDRSEGQAAPLPPATGDGGPTPPAGADPNKRQAGRPPTQGPGAG